MAQRSAIASFVQSLLAIGMTSRNTCSILITLPEIGDYIIRVLRVLNCLFSHTESVPPSLSQGIISDLLWP